MQRLPRYRSGPSAAVAALVVLLPTLSQAAAGPRDLDGSYRVAGGLATAAAVNATVAGNTAAAGNIATPPPRRDCTPVFVAGVGAASTAHIVTGRDALVIVHEANHTVRRVRMGGQHPAVLQPSTFGDSIAWWEGDTLVIETIGLKSGQSVVERLRKVNGGRGLEVIVNGRAMLAELQPEQRYLEDVCETANTTPVAEAAPHAATAGGATAKPPGAAAVAPPPALDGMWQITRPVRALHASDGGLPPLRLDARKLHAERLELFKAGRAAEFNGSDACTPPGEPRTAHGGQAFEIVQGAQAVFFGYSWNRMLRMAFLQPRGSSAPRPSYYGSWSGYWDGDALVLEGTGFRDDTVLDATGLPHSNALQLTQRLSLVKGGDELEIRTTVEDPKVYARSWQTSQRYRRLKDAVIMENICTPAPPATATVPPGKE